MAFAISINLLKSWHHYCHTGFVYYVYHSSLHGMVYCWGDVICNVHAKSKLYAYHNNVVSNSVCVHVHTCACACAYVCTQANTVFRWNVLQTMNKQTDQLNIVKVRQN